MDWAVLILVMICLAIVFLVAGMGMVFVVRQMLKFLQKIVRKPWEGDE